MRGELHRACAQLNDWENRICDQGCTASAKQDEAAKNRLEEIRREARPYMGICTMMGPWMGLARMAATMKTNSKITRSTTRKSVVSLPVADRYSRRVQVAESQSRFCEMRTQFLHAASSFNAGCTESTVCRAGWTMGPDRLRDALRRRDRIRRISERFSSW